MSYSNQELRDIFKKLPEEIKDILSATETDIKIKEIADRNNLGPGQFNEFNKHIGLVLKGLARKTDFVQDLENKLKIDNGLAQKISDETEKEIFGLVKDSLKLVVLNINNDEPKITPRENPFITMPKTFPTQPVQEAPEQVIQKPTPPTNNILEKQGATPLRPDHMLEDHDGLERVDGPHLHSQNIMPQEQGARPAQTGGTIIDDKLSRMVRMPKQDVNIPAKESYKGSDPYREPAN